MNKKTIIYIVVAIVLIAMIGYLMGWFDKKGTSNIFRGGAATNPGVNSPKFIECECNDGHSVCATQWWRGCKHCCSTPSENRVKPVGYKPA